MTNRINIMFAVIFLLSLFAFTFSGVYYLTNRLYPAMVKTEIKPGIPKSGPIAQAQGYITANDHIPVAADTTAPTITVLVPADADYTTNPVRVSFAASDTTNTPNEYESGLDCSTLRFEIDDDGVPGIDYTYSASIICGGMTANLANAPYPVGRMIHLQASVQDKDGNIGNSQVISLHISDGLTKPLSVYANANGTVNGNLGLLTNCTNSNGICTAVYSTGDSVTLTARPNAGYIVSGWGGACGHLGKGNTICTLTLNEAQAVDVFFYPAVAPPFRLHRYGDANSRKSFGAHQIMKTTSNAESATAN